jgi:hypothetical protein
MLRDALQKTFGNIPLFHVGSRDDYSGEQPARAS